MPSFAALRDFIARAGRNNPLSARKGIGVRRVVAIPNRTSQCFRSEPGDVSDEEVGDLGFPTFSTVTGRDQFSSDSVPCDHVCILLARCGHKNTKLL